MVAVVILSMMAFTLDAVFSQEGSHFVMLGVLLGGIILAFAGVSTGRWMQYGIAGAILGGVSGFVLPDLISPANAVIRTSTLGTFDERRIADLMLKRNVANGFMFQAFEKTIGPGMGRFAPQFQFYSGNVEDDMTFGELMRAEADELQIVVTDRMVFDYINKRTDNKLTKAMFAEIRNGLSSPGPWRYRCVLACATASRIRGSRITGSRVWIASIRASAVSCAASRTWGAPP